LRRHRARLAVRRWEYRQRDLAKGTWLRLRRSLASVERAFLIDESDADALEAEGCARVEAARSLEPPKRWLFVPEDRVAGLPSAREVPVRLSAEVLAAPALALVPFAGSVL
jgi:hypothetical protein